MTAEGESLDPRTRYFRDTTKSIIARNESPDVGFETSINVYRGCSHGCSYCFARPFHEYLGFSSGLDFETRIMVKPDAPALLRRELSSKKWRPQLLLLSGVTDPYQPVERKLGITRACLEVLLEARNPVGIITKNHLVTRDIDLLRELAAYQAVAVNISLTTLRNELQRVMEPQTSIPARRLAAVEKLADAGVPVGVMVAPVIPGLTDEELPAILNAARAAGASWAGFVALRLPYAVKEIFTAWLEQHFPDRKEKVLNRIREMHGGRLYDSRWVARGKGEGVMAGQLAALFQAAHRRAGFPVDGHPVLVTHHFRRPSDSAQFGLFQ